MAAEEWRLVGDLPYEVSDLGRVRRIGGITLKPRINRDGYERVSLGTRREALVSRLVLEAFVGPCPPGYEAAHADGDRRRNRLSNLRYATHAENIADKHRHGTQTRGDTHPVSKLNSTDVERLRSLRGTAPHTVLAAMFGISRSHIGKILRGENWA